MADLVDALKAMVANTPAGLVATVLDRVLPDPTARSAAAIELARLQAAGTFDQRAELQLAGAQIEVNKVEAAAGDLFRGGWRPCIGWMCSIALAVQYLIGPLVQWGCMIAGHQVPELPRLDPLMWQLLFGLLGFGQALRTFEKIKGAA